MLAIHAVTSTDEPEPTWADCRLCSGEELMPGEVHVCAYAGNEPMPPELESALLDAMNAAPIDLWHGPSSPWAVDLFHVCGWQVAVFFDGPNPGSWDYIEYVITPDGIRYDSWPQQGERALPMSVTNWQPAQMGPIEDAVRSLTRIKERFEAMTRSMLGR